MAVMQRTGSSAAGKRLPIIPKWEDRQVCLITCSAYDGLSSPGHRLAPLIPELLTWHRWKMSAFSLKPAAGQRSAIGGTNLGTWSRMR
jgi:hypothetical protein